MTLECRDTKIWPVSACIIMCLPLGAEPTNSAATFSYAGNVSILDCKWPPPWRGRANKLTDNCEFDGHIGSSRRRSGEIILGAETPTAIEVDGAGYEGAQNHMVDQVRFVEDVRVLFGDTACNLRKLPWCFPILHACWHFARRHPCHLHLSRPCQRHMHLFARGVYHDWCQIQTSHTSINELTKQAWKNVLEK